MTHYHKLSTEKYYYDSVLDEVKDIRRQRNRDAIRSFSQFLMAIGVFAFSLYAIETMPTWMPTVTAFLDQYGITPKLQHWLGRIG